MDSPPVWSVIVYEPVVVSRTGLSATPPAPTGRTHLHHRCLGQPIRPNLTINVAPHRHHGGDLTQSGQHSRAAHITRVNDLRTASQRIQRLRPDQAVGIGDDAHEPPPDKHAMWVQPFTRQIQRRPRLDAHHSPNPQPRLTGG